MNHPYLNYFRIREATLQNLSMLFNVYFFRAKVWTCLMEEHE